MLMRIIIIIIIDSSQNRHCSFVGTPVIVEEKYPVYCNNRRRQLLLIALIANFHPSLVYNHHSNFLLRIHLLQLSSHLHRPLIDKQKDKKNMSGIISTGQTSAT